MPKISDKQREGRRQQILEAALACFADDGFHQTGMADIVKRSGLSHGAVYLYFQSKDDLIEALADDLADRSVAGGGLTASGQNSRPPSGTAWPGPSSTTSPSASGMPSVSTSDMNLPIWRGGKFTTAATWRPINVSGR